MRLFGHSLLARSVRMRYQSLHAGDLVVWDKNGNGYYVMPKNRWYVESGRYDEKNAGGGLGQWDRDHHYDVWGKVCARGYRADGCVLHIEMQLLISSNIFTYTYFLARVFAGGRTGGG